MSQTKCERGCVRLKISWTSLTRAEECKRQDFLVRKGARSDFQDRRNFLQGTIVDLAMRTFLETAQDRGPAPFGVLGEYVKQQFDLALIPDPTEKGVIKWRGDPEQDKRQVLSRCLEAAERLEPWLYEHVLAYDYQPEARGVGTIGIPDEVDELQRVDLFYATDVLVRQEEGHWAIYDLKITQNEAYTQGKTLGQLTFYALGLSACLGIPVTDFKKLSFVTPLLKNIEQTVYPDAEDFRYMVTRITAYAQDRWAGDYSPKAETDSGCTYRCPVRHQCPLFAMPSKKMSLMAMAELRKGNKI